MVLSGSTNPRATRYFSSPHSVWLPHASPVSAHGHLLSKTLSDPWVPLLASRPWLAPGCHPGEGSEPLLGSALHVPSW